MRINTKTGTLKLDKREEETLTKASDLLAQICRYTQGDLQHEAADARECVDDTLADLRQLAQPAAAANSTVLDEEEVTA